MESIEMHDCFNMAYQDNANALQLHIKSKEPSKYLLPKRKSNTAFNWYTLTSVNSENLLPVSQKYNAGSLR